MLGVPDGALIRLRMDDGANDQSTLRRHEEDGRRLQARRKVRQCRNPRLAGGIDRLAP